MRQNYSDDIQKQYYKITDDRGKTIFVINSILYKGKRRINWDDVEEYLKIYVGKSYEIKDAHDVIHIAKDFPDEYSHSEDTMRLKGTLAKAKANASQGIPYLIQNATDKRYKENLAKKHRFDAQKGWYRYMTRFALPVFSDTGEICRYNCFRIEVLVRHSNDGKKYLYDLVNIKKETSTPLES